jgi:hypothetical protein
MRKEFGNSEKLLSAVLGSDLMCDFFRKKFVDVLFFAAVCELHCTASTNKTQHVIMIYCTSQ